MFASQAAEKSGAPPLRMAPPTVSWLNATTFATTSGLPPLTEEAGRRPLERIRPVLVDLRTSGSSHAKRTLGVSSGYDSLRAGVHDCAVVRDERRDSIARVRLVRVRNDRRIDEDSVGRNHAWVADRLRAYCVAIGAPSARAAARISKVRRVISVDQVSSGAGTRSAGGAGALTGKPPLQRRRRISCRPSGRRSGRSRRPDLPCSMHSSSGGAIALKGPATGLSRTRDWRPVPCGVNAIRTPTRRIPVVHVDRDDRAARERRERKDASQPERAEHDFLNALAFR